MPSLTLSMRRNVKLIINLRFIKYEIGLMFLIFFMVQELTFSRLNIARWGKLMLRAHTDNENSIFSCCGSSAYTRGR